jgi:tetratricopeptide (TPR) repeat protein
MRDPVEEPAQLLALEEFLAPCQALVTFNGKSFDAPLLNTRYLIHGWRSPLLERSHVDLLHLARRLWRDRLPSRTLGNLEIQILGSERTEEDIPGWAIPQMYFDYLRSGDPTPLKSVFYHNAMDVVSLAALFNHMASLLANPGESPIEHGVDLIALARLYEDLGEIDAAVELYLHGLDFEDHSTSPIAPEFRLTRSALLDAIQRLAMIHKHRDDYETAVTLWEKAAGYQHIQAHIELAKFYEHRLRDYQVALSWSKSALDLVNSESFQRFERLRWQPELETRIERLMRKLRGSEGL